MSNIGLKHFTTFGQALAEGLLITEQSNRNFAQKIGVHESQVSNWLSGRNTPYKRTRKKIIEGLGLDITLSELGWSLGSVIDNIELPLIHGVEEIDIVVEDFSALSIVEKISILSVAHNEMHIVWKDFRLIKDDNVSDTMKNAALEGIRNKLKELAEAM